MRSLFSFKIEKKSNPNPRRHNNQGPYQGILAYFILIHPFPAETSGMMDLSDTQWRDRAGFSPDFPFHDLILLWFYISGSILIVRKGNVNQ